MSLWKRFNTLSEKVDKLNEEVETLLPTVDVHLLTQPELTERQTVAQVNVIYVILSLPFRVSNRRVHLELF